MAVEWPNHHAILYVVNQSHAASELPFPRTRLNKQRLCRHMHLKIEYVGLDYGTIGRVSKRRIHSEGSRFIVVTSRVQVLFLSMLPPTLHFSGTHPR